MSGPRPLRRRVEHVDTDAAGVVHFTRYASLIETALLEDLEAMGVGTRLMSEHKLQPAVTELRMRYGAAARFPDRIEVRAGIDHVGGASWRVSGTVRRLPDHADTGVDDADTGTDRAGVGPDRAGVGPDRAGPGVERAGVGVDRAGCGIDRADARAGTLLATGTLVMCLVNAADGSPAPLPAALRAALRAQLSEERNDGRDR
ncbi:thioesterase family protein [Nonomuraea sp. NEAU-A123]|uniref:acyl-CoA thioesterase n=1 Tax=Nonomuraea sp. NEAU-A123 TaxID=2839649 RepID=UPI001BE43585|nr:acyl-CoA thioesterase [Nonomuraea sp. NEAU-A123]MBT2227575.1 acyl-CoA thioesterase [Nonomuraea sp. NEAU-A123]